MRLGRISYVNMAPVFYGLEADVEEVTGVPTELSRMLLDGELDIAPIPSIEYARQRRHASGSCRALCVSSEGAVDSIQLVTRLPFGQVRSVAVTPGERDVGRAHADPAPEGRDRPARDGGGREAAHRRRGAAQRLRGPDAALRPRPALARADRAADGVRRVGGARARRSTGLLELEHALVSSVRLARSEPERLARQASETYGYPAGFLARYFEKLRYSFGPRERAGLYTFFEMARDVGELDHVPELRFVREEAKV